MAERLTARRLLLIIILVAVFLRLAAALYLGNEVVELPGTFDQISYHNLALRVLGGHGFSFGETWWPATPADEPTAHWSFLYTLYLVSVYWLTGANPLVARLLQAVITGIALPGLVYLLATRLFPLKTKSGQNDETEPHWVALLAAAISAIYVYFVYYAAALMTESFYIVAILWTLTLALRIRQRGSEGWRHWLLLGLALGVTTLLRQLFLLFIPFLLLWLWWTVRPRLRYLAAVPVVVLLLILPWTIRNYYAFDHFVLLNTNAGFAFYWGNHPIYGTEFEPILSEEKGSYQDLLPQDLLDLNEAQLDSAVLRLALENIAGDPLRYVQLSLSRIVPYFVFWPSPDSGTISNWSRVLSFGLFLPFMLIGLIISLLDRKLWLPNRLAAPSALIFLFMLFYAGVHFATWTLIRYRLPIDACLIPFAALSIRQLARPLWTVAQQKLNPVT